ncbi:hypothetical protein FA13DRAFT_204244 [Coprinellus micaceus]|uniref:Uncharacterized protein n=1 Tax=Coprinellus micaceus TaxID=71717 RepID=A0A4Y7SFM9_COPMI|nr:hypothetical protein FA13DRAFT_204244 [Coprinellus micaceus]
MASEGDSMHGEEPYASPLSFPAPENQDSDLEHESRSLLDKAFKHTLIAVPLPAIAILVWFVNMTTYLFDRSPRLCEVTVCVSLRSVRGPGNHERRRYCIHLINLILLLTPITFIFLIVALFPLGRYNSTLQTINLLGTPEGTGPLVTQATEDPERSQTSAGDDGTGYWAPLPLRALTITTHALGALWAVSSLMAIANATLVLQRDIPHPGEPRTYATRIYLGYGESLLDGVIAYLLCKTAVFCAQARRARAGEGAMARRARAGEGAMASHPAVEGREIDLPMGGLRHMQTVSDETVLCLLRSLVLSVISSTFYIIFAPWSHSMHFQGRYYFPLSILSFLFAWVVLLIIHSYRSADILLGGIVRILIFGLSLILAVIWVLYGVAFVIVSVRALFCDPRSPTPPGHAPCVYISHLAAWAGVAAGVLGMFQAGAWAGVVAGSWKARGGQIRLVDGENEDVPSTVEENSLP